MGLGGLAFAMQGCDVTLTDLAPVLGLLRHNVEQNLTLTSLAGECCPSFCIDCMG